MARSGAAVRVGFVEVNYGTVRSSMVWQLWSGVA